MGSKRAYKVHDHRRVACYEMVIYDQNSPDFFLVSHTEENRLDDRSNTPYLAENLTSLIFAFVQDLFHENLQLISRNPFQQNMKWGFLLFHVLELQTNVLGEDVLKFTTFRFQ